MFCPGIISRIIGREPVPFEKIKEGFIILTIDILYQFVIYYTLRSRNIHMNHFANIFGPLETEVILQLGKISNFTSI